MRRGVLGDLDVWLKERVKGREVRYETGEVASSENLSYHTKDTRLNLLSLAKGATEAINQESDVIIFEF